MITAQILTMDAKVRQFAAQHKNSILAAVLMCICPLGTFAQSGHSHSSAAQTQEIAADQKSQAGELIRIVRENTERFKDVAAAERAGYTLTFGCVSGPDSGAMGLHYVNFDLVGKGVLDPTQPQIVIYEAQPDGRLKLIGADFLVDAAQWNSTHKDPPELMGQLFHLFDAPNRFRLNAFYTLHVWAWKDNPNGAFVNWHPNVSCQNFSGATTP
jgi:hypothetical protein